MNVLRIKINNVVMGLLVSSQKKNLPNVTYVDYIWVNEKYTDGFDQVNEGMYYQIIYDIFLQWHENFIVKSIKKNPNTSHKIALSLNVTKDRQVERFRRVLTLYGFNIDTSLTIEEVSFKTPYREKEKITHVVYSRII